MASKPVFPFHMCLFQTRVLKCSFLNHTLLCSGPVLPPCPTLPQAPSTTSPSCFIPLVDKYLHYQAIVIPHVTEISSSLKCLLWMAPFLKWDSPRHLHDWLISSGSWLMYHLLSSLLKLHHLWQYGQLLPLASCLNSIIIQSSFLSVLLCSTLLLS